EAPRWLRSSGKEYDYDEFNHEVNSTRKTGLSSLQLYWDQSYDLKDLSLFQLYLHYKFVKVKWVKCNKDNIVHIWPWAFSLQNGSQ
ncbi:4236_t:CDS:1, partial [Racocetra persica]